MGKVAVIQHSKGEITLSMVKWGRAKRSAFHWGKKLRVINRFFIALFTPKYEIAVYKGGPKAVLCERPVYIFYYPTEMLAFRKWDELASILEREGIFGTADFIRAGHPREQGLVSNLNFEGDFP